MGKTITVKIDSLTKHEIEYYSKCDFVIIGSELFIKQSTLKQLVKEAKEKNHD